MSIMKNFLKTIFAVFFALAVTGCDMDDDNLGVDLENLDSPANLGATFQITQDNTGLVTITPTGGGCKPIFSRFWRWFRSLRRAKGWGAGATCIC